MAAITVSLCSRSVLILYLAAVAIVVSHALAQAPGDGDELCVEPFLENSSEPNPFYRRPSYAANVRVLMDSRNYEDLLEGRSPAWQQVDNDDNNTMDAATSVSELLHASPATPACER